MNLSNDREFEAALERVSALLDSPPAAGAPEAREFDELLAAIAAYGLAAPTPSTDSAFDRIRRRADELSAHAARVRRAFEGAGPRGFGGLPLGGEGMGPTTGAQG